ncbi:MAG: inorganic phosphate transporter [Deltaproteobacteria bacterium]|nr:inorganic phosphate transporter [Deltaproteobacteria bacterium]
MASASISLVVFIIAVALVFDFINGFHDSANSIATIVSTRVLSPRVAVLWAAFFNFAAAFGMGTLVASTIGKGIVDPSVVDPHLILAALGGAIVWNLITWWLGLPSSSSHALIGGLAGAALVKTGVSALVLWEPTQNPIVYKGILGIAVYIAVAPLLGFVLGLSFMVAMGWIFRRKRPSSVDTLFRRLQLVSAAVYSYSHGSNDAQKTMGIIYALLIAAGLGQYAHAGNIVEANGALVVSAAQPDRWELVADDGQRLLLEPSADLDKLLKTRANQHVQVFGERSTTGAGIAAFTIKDHLAWWIILTCHLAIALGTYFGGWRIVKTMGSKITKLQPVGGFCAETGGGVTILAMSHFGIPVSTTHTITGAIIGIGTTRRLTAVRWGVARSVVIAWVVTIPAAAIVAALCYLPFKLAQ